MPRTEIFVHDLTLLGGDRWGEWQLDSQQWSGRFPEEFLVDQATSDRGWKGSTPTKN